VLWNENVPFTVSGNSKSTLINKCIFLKEQLARMKNEMKPELIKQAFFKPRMAFLSFTKSMNKKVVAILLMAIIFVGARAQQNTGFRQGSIISPQVNEGNMVTFRLKAPLAHSVTIKGDWETDGGKGSMTKDANGVWSFTTPSLPSDMYLYTFNVDSVQMLDPTNAFVVRDVGNLFSVVITNKGNGDYYSVKDVPHGSVTRSWYPSATFSTSRRLTVYTPPGYEVSKARYPVLYLLHGSGGDEEAWVSLGAVPRIMDNLLAEGKVEPMIVVMPNGNPSKQAAPGETKENLAYRPVMSNTLPGYKEGSYELSFKEIVDFVDKRYRTKPEKSKRAVAGLSMGGFHSLFISANHPDVFDYAGLFSPGINFKTVNMTIPAYSNLETKLAVQMKKGFKLYWMAIGTTDALFEPLQEYKKTLDNLHFPYTYVQSTRGHIWSNWRSYLLQFTPLLFKK
jgi:enterochelin esterase-like enzyme